MVALVVGLLKGGARFLQLCVSTGSLSVPGIQIIRALNFSFKLVQLAGKVEIGGIVKKTKHPNGKDFGYGPQMVEISRDGQRVYWTNSLYSTWDEQFYPGERGAAMVMARVGAGGGLTLDPDFWVEFPAGYRSHQIRLEGGYCSTDSFCFPSV